MRVVLGVRFAVETIAFEEGLDRHHDVTFVVVDRHRREAMRQREQYANTNRGQPNDGAAILVFVFRWLSRIHRYFEREDSFF